MGGRGSKESWISDERSFFGISGISGVCGWKEGYFYIFYRPFPFPVKCRKVKELDVPYPFVYRACACKNKSAVVDDVNLNTRNEQYRLVHVGWLMGLSVVGIWVNRSR